MLKSLPLIAALALLGVSASAHAEHSKADRSQSRLHFEAAEKQFKAGKFAAALVDYERAYDVFPHPGFLFNIAQCHRNLGDYERAIFFLQSYLRDSPKAQDRARITTLIEKLERKAAARPPDVEPEPAAPALVAAPAPESNEDSIFGTWWFWTIVGVAVVAGTGGVVAASSTSATPPQGSIALFDLR